jgi:phosphohistidine swiveling domain-containing protein
MITDVALPRVVGLNGTGCDSTQVGGKSAGLDRLASHGFPIPKSFAITVTAYREYVDTHGLTGWLKELKGAPLPEPGQLADAAAEVERVFMDGSMPQVTLDAIVEVAAPMLASGQVALRSSATAEDLGTASFAGQYLSFLRVDDLEGVLTAVRRCWASLWLPPARSYRSRQRIDVPDLAMAVVLQEMLDPDWSGVAFTEDPKGVPNVMRIEMVPGLGEALVSGRVTPHDFIVRRSTLEIEGADGRVAPDFMESLARMLLQVEHLLDAPQDVEWAYADGELTLLQARPITVSGPMTVFDDGFDSPVGTSDAFTPRGVVEMLPGVLPPLLWTINSVMLESAFRDVVSSLGHVSIDPDREFVGRFGGRAALNLSALQDVAEQISGGSAGNLETQLLGQVESESFDEELPDGGASVRSMMRARRAQAHMEDEVELATGSTRGILDMHVDVTALPARELVTYQHAIRDLAWRIYSAELAASSAAVGSYQSLTVTLRRWLDHGEAQEWAQRLTAGVLADYAVGVVRMNELRDVCDRYLPLIPDLGPALVAKPTSRARDRVENLGADGLRFIREVDETVRRHGSRAVYGGATCDESPDEVWKQLALHAGDEMPPALMSAPDATYRTLMGLIKGSRRWNTLRVFTGQIIDLRERWLRRQANETIHLLSLRERAKDALLSLGGEEHRIIFEGARRLVESRQLLAAEDALLLSSGEFRSMLLGSPPLPEAVLFRRLSVSQRCLSEGLLPPRFVGSPGNAPSTSIPETSTLKGWAASPGIVAGQARVVMSVEQGGRLRAGDILVAPTTDASWTPLMLTAGGLVLEEGGPLSHGAIVAREFGLPAVLNIPRVTEAVEDGETIEVDGFAGLVRRTELASMEEGTS